MYKEILKVGIKDKIVEIQYKSLDYDLNKLLLNIVEVIEKRLIEKNGKFFLINFETCINWKII
jgi:hypothetical protein